MNIASEQNDPPPFIEIVAHIRARRQRSAAIFSVCIGLSLLMAALLKPTFTATAVLAVLPAPEFTVRQSAGSHAFSTSALAMDQIMKAETAILESTELHSATLQAIGIAQLYPNLGSNYSSYVSRMLSTSFDVLLSPWRTPPTDTTSGQFELALERLDDHLRVLPAKDANIITVTFAHPDRFMAAQVINGLLAHYAERRRQLYDDPQLTAVRHEAESLGLAVRNADSNIAMFKARHLLTDEAVELDLLVRRQSAEAQALADAQSQALEQRTRVATLDQQIAKTTPVIALYEERDPDTRLQAIDGSVVTLRGQLATSRLRYQESSRHVVDLMGQLNARLQDRRRLALDRSPSVARRGRNATYDALLLARAVAATDQAAAQSRIKASQAEQDTIAARLAAMPRLEAMLADLVRVKAVADAAFANAGRVLAEQHMTESEDALRLANVRVIEAARVPQRQDKTAILVIIAGCLLGIVSAALSMILGLFIHPTMRTPEGLSHATGLSVLGVFGRDPSLHRTYPAL